MIPGKDRNVACTVINQVNVDKNILAGFLLSDVKIYVIFFS